MEMKMKSEMKGGRIRGGPKMSVGERGMVAFKIKVAQNVLIHIWFWQLKCIAIALHSKFQ